MKYKKSLSRNLIFVLIGLSFTQYSCKKKIELCEEYTVFVDEKVQHKDVKSNPYLAAYPGSWWNFSDGKLLECNLGTFIGYNYYEEDEKKCVKHLREAEYTLPVITGGITSLYINNTSTLTQTKYRTISSDLIRFEKNVPWEMNSESHTRVLVNVLDSVVLPNDMVFYDILHIHDKVVWETKIGTASMQYSHYYAKDIGLIWRYDDYINPDDLEYNSQYITDYYIAPH